MGRYGSDRDLKKSSLSRGNRNVMEHSKMVRSKKSDRNGKNVNARL